MMPIAIPSANRTISSLLVIAVIRAGVACRAVDNAHDQRAEKQICDASRRLVGRREKRRRAKMASANMAASTYNELDAAIMEFLKLHRAETDTIVLQGFQRWVRGAA